MRLASPSRRSFVASAPPGPGRGRGFGAAARGGGAHAAVERARGAEPRARRVAESTRSDPCPAFLFVVFVRRGGDARRRGARSSRRGCICDGPPRPRARIGGARRRAYDFLRMPFGRAARADRRNGLRRRGAAARGCDAAWRASACGTRVSLCLLRCEGTGASAGDTRARGGETDARRWWRVTRRSGHPARRRRRRRAKRARARGACRRARAYAARAWRHRPRTRRHRRPAGTSPSRGGKERRRPSDARAPNSGARRFVHRDSSAPCDSRCKSAPEKDDSVSPDGETWTGRRLGTRGARGTRASPRSRCRALATAPAPHASRCPARSLGRCPEDVPAARYFTRRGGG